ncbi:molybdopterin-guanine dinucleotide biosynthesis protein A [Prosthecobacter debontii]|uniref:Molybdopterin-guanine dinucleotide biosynthesis protein A n=1 Tax=Prosthecobacter debontii TaxID=48467 RepID=A0A1T4X951_9BACT|nr:molybdenum cofactor guanylyltransferase [Prosthecobacter debontii]SKA86134.1 molybdopterin-guanine dinucleotide biosynthesis protein A [Prosthecobacter debontii]
MSDPTPVPGYSALLLAGGRSTRMGEDKAFLPWQGKPLWQGQIQKLRMLKPARLIVACREGQGLHQTAEPEVEWLFDPPGTDVGPIGPVSRALALVQMPLVVLAVDMPEMNPAFLSESIAELPPDQALFFRASHGIEPLAGVYTPALIPLMEKALEDTQLSMRRLIEDAVNQGLAIVQPVSPSTQVYFANTNTPDEWSEVVG